MRPFLVFFDAALTLNDLTIADGIAQDGGGIFNFGDAPDESLHAAKQQRELTRRWLLPAAEAAAVNK